MTNTTTLPTSTFEALSRRPSQPEPLGLLDSEPGPAGVVIAETVERARPGLEALGDTDRVQDAVARIQRDGNGATRQRRVLEDGDVAAVVSMARRAATEARSG